MIIRKAKISDLESICSVHKYAFDKDHFSSILPQPLLVKFYSELLRNNHYNYIAINEDNRILGFIVAGRNTGSAINTFIKRSLLSLFLVLLKNPRFLSQKIRLVINKLIYKNEFHSQAGLRLLSIAVIKDSVHKGIGTQLIRHFENELIGNDIFIYGLSVKKHNQNAINFYIKNHFEVEKEEKEAYYFVRKLEKKS
jgi:ribosomal protein S18 acetylase RimI-like enzyme